MPLQSSGPQNFCLCAGRIFDIYFTSTHKNEAIGKKAEGGVIELELCVINCGFVWG